MCSGHVSPLQEEIFEVRPVSLEILPLSICSFGPYVFFFHSFITYTNSTFLIFSHHLLFRFQKLTKFIGRGRASLSSKLGPSLTTQTYLMFILQNNNHFPLYLLNYPKLTSFGSVGFYHAPQHFPQIIRSLRLKKRYSILKTKSYSIK